MTIFNQIGHLAHQVNRSALGLHLAVGCNSERLNCRVSIVRAAAVTAIILAGQPVLAESGPDAMRALIGNTLVGKLPDKKTFYIYFRADGTMMTFGEGFGESQPSHWRYQGSQLCLGGGGENAPECYRLDVVGAHGTLVGVDEDESIPFDILPGNPKNL